MYRHHVQSTDLSLALGVEKHGGISLRVELSDVDVILASIHLTNHYILPPTVSLCQLLPGGCQSLAVVTRGQICKQLSIHMAVIYWQMN